MGSRVARLLPWIVLGALVYAVWRDLHPRTASPVRLSTHGPDCREVAALSVDELRRCAKWRSQEQPQGARLRPID